MDFPGMKYPALSM